MSQLWNMVFAIVLNIIHQTYYNQFHYSGQIRYSYLQGGGRHVWVLKLAAPQCLGRLFSKYNQDQAPIVLVSRNYTTFHVIWSTSRRHYVIVQSFFYFFFDVANQILFYNQ